MTTCSATANPMGVCTVDLKRIRKAIVAGVGAGGSAAVAVVAKGLSDGLSAELVGQALGAFVIAAVPVGWAAYKVRNARTVDGSDPQPN